MKQVKKYLEQLAEWHYQTRLIRYRYCRMQIAIDIKTQDTLTHY